MKPLTDWSCSRLCTGLLSMKLLQPGPILTMRSQEFILGMSTNEGPLPPSESPQLGTAWRLKSGFSCTPSILYTLRIARSQVHIPTCQAPTKYFYLLLPQSHTIADPQPTPPTDVKMHVSCLATSNTIDRKSTRLNSSHLGISYAVFCLKK